MNPNISQALIKKKKVRAINRTFCEKFQTITTPCTPRKEGSHLGTEVERKIDKYVLVELPVY